MLIAANLRGVDSHGIALLPTYVRCIRAGGMVAGAQPEIIADGALVTMDGQDGIGPLIAQRATELCLERAAAHGAAAVTVRRSNHVGMLAYYALQFARAEMVGVVLTNNGPNLAPWGGRERLLGNNALAVAVPVQGRPPLVYDIATGAVAASRVRLAAERGELLPPGCIVDARGQPSTDPRDFLAGGAVLPFGQYKGMGLAILIDIFTGLLSGGVASPDVGRMVDDPSRPSRAAQTFLAWRPAALTAVDLAEGVAGLVAALQAAPPAPDAERVLVPGEKEERTEVERRRRGIPLTEPELQALTGLAVELGLDW